MKFNNFSISNIIFLESNGFIETSVFLNNKNDLGNDFFGFTYKEEPSTKNGYFTNNTNIKNFLKYYNLSDDKDYDMLEYFQKIFLKKYLNNDNISNLKSKKVEEIILSDFDSFKSEIVVDLNYDKFCFFNDDESNFFTLYYERNNKNLRTMTIRNVNSNKIENFHIYKCEHNEKLFNELLNKLKGSNKYRMKFLLNTI